jgi:L-asparagine transporter-like permease
MLALGTVIGGSFFLGSSVAINAAGPSIVIAYIFGGVLVYYILYAMSEMTVANPSYGSFRVFTANAFGEGAGFVVGWIYWTGMVIGMSSEATAAAILVRNWVPAVTVPFLGSVIIAGVTLLNLLGSAKLSRLESGLAAIKVFTVVSFILTAALLILGMLPGRPAVGLGAVLSEPFAPGGLAGLAGSMLIVMFSYCGFEIIGLAASEVGEPEKTIPRAIRYTVISLVGMFIVYIVLLLPLIPTATLNENTSAIAASLGLHGIGWAGTVINAVLISAIVSTMLATMFGLGRMMRSLADERHAPGWLRDKTDVPYRGIAASGVCMLASLWFGLLFPRVYLFLLSSGGFSILFTYAAMMASHLRFRRKYGCPPSGKCQMHGYPYTTIFVLVSLIGAIFSMPFIEGQTSGLIAGISFVAFFSLSYLVLKRLRGKGTKEGRLPFGGKARFSAEFSEELHAADQKEEDERG